MTNETMSPNENENITKISNLIKDIQIAMLTTLDEKGRMQSRPMVAQKTEFDGNLWFLTSDSSHKTSELRWNRQVHIVYAKPEKYRFVSITGTGRIIRDQNKTKELWSPIYHAWFPKGLKDPDLVLIKIEVDHAEYWEATSDSSTQVIGLTKPISTEKKSDRESTKHGEIDIAG